jgi:hypothetical protein
MPPRRPPTLAATLAVALLVGALSSAAAQAATVGQKIDKILTTEYKAEVAYSATAINGNVSAAQTKLATTASAIDSLSSSDSSAATALVDELENQYDVAGAAGLFKPVLTAMTALSKLPLTHAEHKDAVAGVTYVKRVLAINTTADLTRWHDADYATGSEPADTSAFGGIIGVSLPSVSLPITGSESQVKAFVKLENKASAKVTAVFNTLSGDWSNWAAGFGIESG